MWNIVCLGSLLEIQVPKDFIGADPGGNLYLVCNHVPTPSKEDD